ncbi:MAG: hypothetical protein ASARMPRED_001256 [Alectoria sarmentosa]|nr:MAG: hypothetical protein ASARMPRED_001256 [Alectoria sarmentosa]
MALSLEGKIAIVTGASRSRGIGSQVAYDLARRGAKVVLTFVSPSSEKCVDELVKRIEQMQNGSAATKVQADLRQVHAPEKIVQAARSAFGDHIDILVNNAGCELVKGLGDISADDFSYVYDLNVRAVLLMSKEVLPYLRAPGRIINVSSIGARLGLKDLSVYCSSKAAVEGLTRCFAAELGTQGHTVNTVNPGPVPTDVLDGIPKELVEMHKNMTPVEKRLGTTDDIGQIVGFLSEESSRWITGQAISASGGFSMY